MARLNRKIGLIGGGNMGEAFIGAMLKTGLAEPSQLFVTDINKIRLEKLKKQYHINVLEDNFLLFSTCEIVILAIKPQQMNEVLSRIADQDKYEVNQHKLIISIAAGIRIKKIETILYASLEERSQVNLAIIRVMPNTPALVLEGMSGMSPNKNSSPEDIVLTRTILDSMGKVIQFNEEALDAVTAVSGSGPAYVFYVIESMIQGGMEIGLSQDNALTLTLQTLKGSIKLLENGTDSPEVLRKKVTSPGGTTEAALKVFEENHVKQLFIAAIDAAVKRAKELSR